MQFPNFKTPALLTRDPFKFWTGVEKFVNSKFSISMLAELATVKATLLMFGAERMIWFAVGPRMAKLPVKFKGAVRVKVADPFLVSAGSKVMEFEPEALFARLTASGNVMWAVVMVVSSTSSRLFTM